MKAKDWIVVGIGAFLGILFASQFGVSWWFGLLGGLLAFGFGYLAGNPREMSSKLKLAIQYSKRELPPFLQRQMTFRKDWWQKAVWLFAFGAVVISWAILFYGFVGNTITSEYPYVPMIVCTVFSLVFTVLLLLFLLIMFEAKEFNFNWGISSEYCGRPRRLQTKVSLFSILFLSPPGFVLVLLAIVLYFCRLGIKATPMMARFIGKTTRLFFHFIHSEKRICRGTYACVGAIAGWYFDRNPVIGAILGVILGFVLSKVFERLKSQAPQVS